MNPPHVAALPLLWWGGLQPANPSEARTLLPRLVFRSLRLCVELLSIALLSVSAPAQQLATRKHNTESKDQRLHHSLHIGRIVQGELTSEDRS